MSRTRIKGKGLVFTVAGVAYECDLTSAVLTKDTANKDTADGVKTFCDVSASSDGLVWKLNTEAIQSTDSGSGSAKSLHTLIWESAVAGAELAFIFKPMGNSAASASQPHYTGTAIVPAGGYPDVGGAAGNDSFTWSYSFEVKDNTVTKVVA